MIQIVLRSTAILAINTVLGIGFCFLVQHDRAPERWQTNGSLFLIGQNESIDMLLLGSSRSLALTQCPGVEQRVEHVLGYETLNLSTIGNGVVPAKIFLEHFYANGNRAKRLIFFADAPFFLSKVTNEQMPNIEEHPFEFRFLWRCAANDVEITRLIEYVRAKFRWKWLWQKMPQTNCERMMPNTRDRFIMNASKKRNWILYHEGVRPERLDRYVGVLEDIIQLALEQNTDVHIVVLPTLLHTEPGQQSMIKWIEPVTSNNGVPLADFSEEMNDPQYFRDLDHFNERGAVHFVRNYLVPQLNPAQAEDR